MKFESGQILPRGTVGLDLDHARHEHELEQEEPERPSPYELFAVTLPRPNTWERERQPRSEAEPGQEARLHEKCIPLKRVERSSEDDEEVVNGGDREKEDAVVREAAGNSRREPPR